MTDFRSYQANVDKLENAKQEYQKIEEKLNHLTLASLTIMCSNYFMEQMIVDGEHELRQYPEFYNKKLKVACEAVRDKAKTLSRNLYKDIVKIAGEKYIYCLADMCDDLDEHMIPVYKSLVSEMQSVFRDEYKLENHRPLSIIFSMDCSAFIAMEISRQIREKYESLDKSMGKLIDVSKVYEKCCKMTSLAALRTPEDTHINLNKHLNVMAKKRRLTDIITDPDTFTNAFRKAGFKLEKPDTDERKSE